MTAREEIKELKRQLKNIEVLNTFLQKKVEQQSKEILKAAKDKGTLASLRKQIRLLQEDNEKLRANLSEYENQEERIIDIQKQQLQKQVQELKMAQIDLRVERLKNADKIAELEYELKQSRAVMVNLPSYGNVPKEVYDYVKSLEQSLQIARSNYYGVSERYDVLLRYIRDEEQNKHVEEYINNYYAKRRGARQKISAEKIKTIKELRESGMSIRDIASIADVSVGSVHRYLK